MESSVDTSVIMGLTIVILPIVGVLMAITPYLMKKSECFTVTVPEAAANDPYLAGLKRRFLIVMLALTVVLSALACVFWAANNPALVLTMVVLGTLGTTLAGYMLMLNNRKKVSAYKHDRGWRAEAQESVAVVGEFETPHAISLRWNLLYLPIMLVTIGIGFAGYGSMPDMIPMQVGFDGAVSRYAEKSIWIVFMPALIQAFMGGAIAFSHWNITHSKWLSEPGAPATSALAYGMFARAQSIMMVVSGVALCVGLVMMPLSFMNVIGLMQAASVIMVIAIIIVVGNLAIAVVYGQGGARLFARMSASDELLADDDRFWKLGIFYYNSDDPSLFLPARFGVGWTFNYARPAIWAIMIAGLVITIAFVIAVNLFG